VTSTVKTNRRSRVALLAGAVGLAIVGGIVAFRSSIQTKLVDLRTPRSSAVPIDPQIPRVESVSGVSFPPVHRFRLKNGLRVMVLEDHRLPRITMRLIFPAGRIYESVPGTAEMTAAMLDQGTETRRAEQLADSIAQLGTSISWSSNQETATLSVTGLSEHTSDLLLFLSDMALHSRFPTDRFELKKRLRVANDITFQGASSLAQSVAVRALYGKNPYGFFPPTAGQIQSLQQADVIAFYDHHYRPNEAILAVAGDIDTRSLQKMVEGDLGKWTPSPQISLPSPAQFNTEGGANAPQVDLIDWAYDKQVYVSLQCLSVSYAGPDFFPLMVANRILGGGSTNRLREDLRENRGFTYSASSDFYALSRYPGIWHASATVPVENVEMTVRDIRTQMDRLGREPVSSEELMRAKNDLIGNSVRLLENPEDALNIAVNAQKAGLPESVYENYTKQIAAVTPADIQRVAAKYFQPGRVHIVVVGPRDKLEPVLTPLGTLHNFNKSGMPMF
jgi:zinc protease